ncbi:efflux RND transporter periplasmic adaptor subunit [Marinivivus vitaminiproducens]|uniref:efflux RND transporter periplasmic adaptor subunit n=1 Tax=Marinivivus vitaminiproducens TaxID=3035935 RepID=UPI0027A9675B|nr:efflux RND transporter periplasmic adaptor subunit [Geminicoccaceae bacterium SCSIO 64248]
MTLIGIAVFGAGLFYWQQHAPSESGRAQAQAPNPPSRPPTAVEVAEAKVDTVEIEIAAVGTLQSNEAVVVAPEIEGRISAILFDEGTEVTAGQPLVKLDDQVVRAELAEAEANLALAEANFQRADTLSRQRIGTLSAKDEALAAQLRARALLTLAKVRLDKTTILAPFDGVLGLRSVSVGEFVEAGDPLVNLESVNPLKVDFRVPETYLPEVHTRQPVEITADALPGRRFTGEIYAIDPLIDVNGRAVQLRARLPNDDRTLRPGMFTRVSILAETRPNAILVPEAALVPQGAELFVFRVADGQAVQTKVTLGARRTGEVEIIEGVAAGDVVVTAGQARLRDGGAVEIVSRDSSV